MNWPFVYGSPMWPAQKLCKCGILAPVDKCHLLSWAGPVIYSDTLYQWEAVNILATWDLSLFLHYTFGRSPKTFRLSPKEF